MTLAAVPIGRFGARSADAGRGDGPRVADGHDTRSHQALAVRCRSHPGHGAAGGEPLPYVGRGP